MKSATTLVIIFLLIGFAYAQEKIRYINIDATAEVSVQADQINFSVHVKHVTDSLSVSKRLTDALIQKLHQILSSYNINDDEIETSPILLGKNYVYENAGSRKQKGFFASSSVTFALKDFTNYFGITDKLSLEEGIENLNSYYSLSDYPKYNIQAYQKALKAAVQKANYMAEALGIKVGSVLEVEEVKSYYPEAYNSINVIASDGEQVISGKVTVSKNVRVKFSIE